MKAICSFLLISLFSFTVQTTANVCPPWFIPDNRSSTGCSCHRYHAGAKCNLNYTLLQFAYCMTHNCKTDTTAFGPCPYITQHNTTKQHDQDFIRLPDNVSLLTEFMCGPLNREGELCGKCKDGYGIALYSYTMECSKCWGHGYGWLLYYFLELVPITVMYFLVVIFHIRATSSPLSALVFMSQIVVYTIRLNVPLHMLINKVSGFHVALQVLLVLCGIWSLDFFRSVIPPFCVSSNIKNVHALALEYLVAFYPICLILLTYTCIKLHDNNFRPVVWLWKPLHRHFVRLRRRWDPEASITNAFTTFLLLSFSKILFISFTLLYTVDIKYDNGDRKCALYYDPTVECNSMEHSIFAAIAGCVLVVFILFPTVLLILYPTRLFRKCVSCCSFRSQHALHMFVESFQGQYKDGANGTRDFRMVSALFLILRILIMASFLQNHYSPQASSELACVLFMTASCFYAITKPYRSTIRNNTANFTLVLLALMSFAFLLTSYHPLPRTFKQVLLPSILVLCVPHTVLILYICHRLAKKAGITKCLKRKYRVIKRCVLAQTEGDVEAESDTGSLPDRLINPEEYEPVLPTTEHTDAESTESEEPDPRWLTPVYTYGSIN